MSIKLVRSCSSIPVELSTKDGIPEFDECFLYVTNPSKTSEVVEVKVMSDGLYYQCKIGTNRHAVMYQYIAELIARVDFSIRDIVLYVYSDNHLFCMADILCVIKSILPFVPSVRQDEVVRDIHKHYLFGNACSQSPPPINGSVSRALGLPQG